MGVYTWRGGSLARVSPYIESQRVLNAGKVRRARGPKSSRVVPRPRIPARGTSAALTPLSIIIVNETMCTFPPTLFPFNPWDFSKRCPALRIVASLYNLFFCPLLLHPHTLPYFSFTVHSFLLSFFARLLSVPIRIAPKERVSRCWLQSSCSLLRFLRLLLARLHRVPHTPGYETFCSWNVCNYQHCRERKKEKMRSHYRAIVNSTFVQLLLC